jgi:hypothetical protein
VRLFLETEWRLGRLRDRLFEAGLEHLGDIIDMTDVREVDLRVSPPPPPLPRSPPRPRPPPRAPKTSDDEGLMSLVSPPLIGAAGAGLLALLAVAITYCVYKPKRKKDKHQVGSHHPCFGGHGEVCTRAAG